MSALTPPAVKTKTTAPKAKADPNAPKKERAPRKDYGYHKDAKIQVLKRPDDAKPYRQMRQFWYELVVKANGKTCAQFVECNKTHKSEKGVVQNPASWLRFFVEDNAIKLNK